MAAASITLTRGLTPGALGRVVELHGLYYGKVWGFGPQFEQEVASDLAAFLARYDPARDGFWLAWQSGRIVGSITLDHTPRAPAQEGARIRWFIAASEAQGIGTGRLLFDALLAFAEETGQPHLHLWTFEGLTAARRLYEQAGFTETESTPSSAWGPQILAQRMTRTAAPDTNL